MIKIGKVNLNVCHYPRRFALMCGICFLLTVVWYIMNNSAVALRNRMKFKIFVEGEHRQEEKIKMHKSSFCNCEKGSILKNELTFSPNKESDFSFQWCSPESSGRGSNQKVISYALYGDKKERYFSLIKNISSTAEQIYPGWIVRIYHNFSNQSVSDKMDFKELCDVHCQFKNFDLCNMSELIKQARMKKKSTAEPIDPDFLHGLQPKMWRFLVMLDSNVDVFISRDLDSMIWQREVDAVEQWLKSKFTFHSMRDHPHHDGFSLLGGKDFFTQFKLLLNLWGCKLFLMMFDFIYLNSLI
jgi:hypothetical protein